MTRTTAWLVLLLTATAAVAAEPDRDALTDPARAPGSVQRALFAAGAQRERGEDAAARATLRRHLAEHPDQDHHLVRYHLGNLLAQADSLAAARVQLEAAVRLAPGLQPAWRNLAEVAYAEGDFARAADAFERAASLAPAGPPALRYYEGVARLQAGQPARALDVLSTLLDEHPGPDLEWHRALLAAAVAAERAPEITDRMDALTRARPDTAATWLLAARQAQAADDYPRAAALMAVAGFLHPLDRSERLLLGDLCQAVGAPARAAGHYEAALDLAGQPSGADWDRLVSARLAAHQTEAALAALEQRLAVEPTAAAWLLRGEVLYGERRFSEALTAFGEAARLDPTDARLDLLQGYSLLELDRHREAVRRLEAARRDERWAPAAREALDHLQRTGGD